MPEGSKHPGLRDWTQSASLLAQLIMEVRQTNAILVQTNSKKGSKSPKIEPVPVPQTAFSRLSEKVRWDHRLRRHDELVRKLLPGRQPPPE